MKSRKAGLGDIGEWFVPALIALVIGFIVAVLMSRGIIPDFLNLF